MNKNELIEQVTQQQFTKEEWSERRRHIGTLKNFAGASIAAAKALVDVRDKKLYRPHKTLKEFCLEECGWSERRLFQVIKFIEIKSALPEKYEPLVHNERQMRELSGVPEEQRVEVLEEAGKNGKVTAKSIRRAASRIGGRIDNGNAAPDKDDAGFDIPEPAKPYWSRKGEAEEILATLRAAKKKVNALDKNDIMWCEVNLNGVLAALEDAISRFRGGVPAHVCDYCQGQHPQKCTVCKGRGIVSEYFRKHCVPTELREMREKNVK